MKPAILLISVYLYATISAGGQLFTDEQLDPQRINDELLAYPDEDEHSGETYENLMQLHSAPYDLNRVSAEELKSLHLLTDEQIDNLLLFRKEQGPFFDVYELQVIPGFDVDMAVRLRPFVSVRDPMNSSGKPLLQRIFSKDHTYLVTRYERSFENRSGSAGKTNPENFIGSPHKMYYRLRSFIPGDFSLGITGEKDAGERITFHPGRRHWGFDFNSFHFQVQNKGKLANLVLGDFQMQFGQGLILGGAFGLGKGGESVSTARRSSPGFLPYTSIDENRYQRGAAFTLQPGGRVRFSGFYSRAQRDANFSGNADSPVITSFHATGYHRSEGELAKRKSATEQSYGLVVQYAHGALDAGVTMHVLQWNFPLKKNPTLYNIFSFQGATNVNAGFFLNYRFRNISFFSELGQSVGAGRAGLAGMLISAHPTFDLAILLRNYSRNFHALYANAFSEGTLPQNERGVYWGWKYRPHRKHNFSGYVDLFSFPWLGFRRYAPSTGYEWLVRAAYHPSKKASAFAQFREERKSRNQTLPGNLYNISEGTKRNVVVQVDYGLGEKLRLRSRVQYNQFHFNERVTQGFAMFQDVRFAVGRFTLTGRHALFDTDHYDNRHYVYEHDAWLAYSLPVYAGHGVRNYALIEYKAHKRLTFWLRYARTRLLEPPEMVSGSDAIAGNMKNDVKFQARFRF